MTQHQPIRPSSTYTTASTGPVGEETSLGRPLAWAAAWGGLGALGAVVAIVMIFNLLLTLLMVAATDDSTVADILPSLWEPAGAVTPGGAAVVLSICAVSALASMTALVVLRRSDKVRIMRPGMQGLVAAVATYAFYSVAGPVLGVMFLAIVGRA